MRNLENAFVSMGLENGKTCSISPASFKSATLLLLVSALHMLIAVCACGLRTTRQLNHFYIFQ